MKFYTLEQTIFCIPGITRRYKAVMHKYFNEKCIVPDTGLSYMCTRVGIGKRCQYLFC